MLLENTKAEVVDKLKKYKELKKVRKTNFGKYDNFEED